MKRDDKRVHLEHLSGILSSGGFLIGLNFSKMSASDFFVLRKGLFGVGAKVLVVKNSVAKLAFANSTSCVESGDLASDKIAGSVAFVYGGSNAISVAKVAGAFYKANSTKLTLLFGLYEGKVISPADVMELVDMPSLAELHARLLYLMSIVVPARIMRALSACATGVVRILDSKSRPSV